MPVEPWPPTNTTQHPQAPAITPPSRLALWCAERGWPVFPLAPGRKTPAANCVDCRNPRHERQSCTCLDVGRWCHGFHAATLVASRITQWWGSRPGLGVGVACGPARLVVIDVDVRPADLPERHRLLPGIRIGERIDLTGVSTGFHTLAVLAALRGAPSPADDEATLRVRTPSGGMHIWYRATDGRPWQCSTGSGARRALAWQVDVRAHGGYIVAPGTTTRSGSYTRVGTAFLPAPIPTWLADELERTGHLPGTAAPGPHQSAKRPVAGRARGGREAGLAVMAPLLADVAACAGTPQDTGFNEKLNRAAYTLGGLAAAGHLDAAEAEAVLLACAVAARPLRAGPIASVVRAGIASGGARPLQLGGTS
ncbi:bifunctional DNA primase/polymerase [Streptomyces sp. NPDC048270]|uniref:bifunctional DNA primase/polymerase n=1 Tax=Streptomyces sp. NPDC048270 TaxID=3154615 RepID=UPI0033F22D70